jgi:hypothetical protein
VSRPGAIVNRLAAAMNEASDAEMDIIESPNHSSASVLDIARFLTFA